MTDSSSTKLLVLVALAVLVINVFAVITWDVSHISNDGIQYLSTARNWLAGNGFSTNALIYAPHFQGEFPAVQTVWPPGYPLVIALFSKLGMDLHQSALAVNLLMHAMASLVILLILRRLEVTSTFAILSAFAFYLMSIPWAYASALLTEPLFTTLLLAALLFLPDIKRSNLAVWVLCGVVIAAGIYVRYSTVFLALGTGIGIFICLIAHQRKPMAGFVKSNFKLALLIAIPAIAFLHLMFRTYTFIGTLYRYSGSKTPESLASTVYLWFAKASELLGFTSSSLLPGSVSKITFVVLVAIAVITTAVFLFQKRASNSEKARLYFQTLSLVACAHAIALILYLTVNSMSSTPLEILPRYVYQIYPGLFAVFCYMLFHVIENFRAKTGGVGIFASGITVAMLAIYFIAQINSQITLRPRYFSEAMGAQAMLNLPVTADKNLTDYTISCFSNSYSEGDAIWSTHGQVISLHTDIPTVTHANIYTDRPFDGNQLTQQIEDYKLQMFFFINFPGRNNDVYAEYMQNMKEWLEEKGLAKVAMQDNQFANGRTVDVYTTTPDCGL